MNRPKSCQWGEAEEAAPGEKGFGQPWLSACAPQGWGFVFIGLSGGSPLRGKNCYGRMNLQELISHTLGIYVSIFF